MNFEAIVAVLTPFFQENNFSIADRLNGYIKYEYKTVTISLGYDPREQSLSVYVGQGGNYAAELTATTLGKFFKEDIKLRNDEFFTENLIQFLNGKGNGLLKADVNTLSQLTEFSNRMAKENMDNQTKEHNLRSADDAWKRKNYAEFLSHLNKIPREALSATYLGKYQYALKKIKNNQYYGL